MSDDVIDELNLINASLEERVKELETQLKTARDINSQQSEQIKMHDAVAERLRARIKGLDAGREAVVDENLELKETVKSLSSQIVGLEDAAKNHQRDDEAYTALSLKTTEREQTIKRLNEEVAVLRGDNDALSAKVADLRKQLDIATDMKYCRRCGENTRRIDGRCYSCIRRDLEEILEHSIAEKGTKTKLSLDEKLDIPLDEIAVTENATTDSVVTDASVDTTDVKAACQQCSYLKELAEQYQDIIEKLTAQLAKAYGLKK